MTLYHFGNCVALIYLPYYFTYKYSGLSEYGAFWKCIQAGTIYVFTQLVKMLLLATFFPDIGDIDDVNNNILEEFLKSTVDLLDLVGLYVVLNGIPGKGHSKVLTAGVGWAGAEVVLSRALFLWVGARGAEFDWRYVQKCLESNIFLIQHITSATLIWLWSRHDLGGEKKLDDKVTDEKIDKKKSVFCSQRTIVTFLILSIAYKTLILDVVLVRWFLIGAWTVLAVKATVTLTLAGSTLFVYAGVAEKMGIF